MKPGGQHLDQPLAQDGGLEKPSVEEHDIGPRRLSCILVCARDVVPSMPVRRQKTCQISRDCGIRGVRQPEFLKA
jgi:hypothetical protein